MPAGTLVHLLARSVESRSNADALVAAGRRVTYEQLWAAVGRGVGFLQGRAIASGDRVALLMRNSPDYAACYYAVLAAGGVVVPLNQEAKAHDLAGWIRHSGTRLVIVDDAHPERPALASALETDAVVVTASDALAGRAVRIDLEAESFSEGDQLASLLYTSGTTGEPKGVMLSHRNLVSNVLAIIEYLRLGPSDRVMTALPFFYSYGNSVLHTHLAVGATVVMGNGMMYPQQTIEMMRDEQVTGFSGVPWMFTLLLTRTAFATMRHELKALRYLTQAGAPMAHADIHRVTSAYPDVEFFVMYGQTEATARLSYQRATDLARQPGSVGRPIPGVRLEVRRPDESIANPGESGEVFAAGPNVMLGYWNAPELTRSVIVEEASGRWLRTGDLGYHDAEGCLVLTGRSSEIIKTGAHRVSPAEIEEAVLRFKGIAEAAAYGVPDAQTGEAIYVAVVAEPGADFTERDVLVHCRAQLSAYKLPRRVIFQTTLPRTSSGKIKRKALAEMADVEADVWLR